MSKDFEPGMRVRLVEDVENFPTVLVPAGECGMIADASDELVYVSLDRHFPELDEWENVLQVSRDDHPDALEVLDEHKPGCAVVLRVGQRS